MRAVAELEAGSGGAAEVAGRHGASRAVPYVWRRGISGHDGGAPEEKGAPVGGRHDGLPDDVEEPGKMHSDLKARVRKLQLEIDVRQATLEILKKTRAPTRNGQRTRGRRRRSRRSARSGG